MLGNSLIGSVISESSFSLTTDFISISGTTETPHVLIKNPSSSIKSIEITSIKLGDDSESYGSTFRIYSNATVTTNGTALTTVNNLFTASASASISEAYKLPTVSSNGSLHEVVLLPSDHPPKGIGRIFVIEPGNNLFITVENGISNLKSMVEIYWLET